MFMPLVFVLLLPAAEPNEAEMLFRDMEKKVNSAKTLECDFEAKLEGTPKKSSAKGSLALAEGNKVHAEVMGNNDGKTQKITMVSDGTKMQSVADGMTRNKEDTPTHFGDNIKAAISRSGIATIQLIGDDPAKDLKIDDLFKVSDFKLGKKEKVGDEEAQEIQYHLTAKGVKEPLAFSVWIDTKTHLPLKRVVSLTEGNDKITLTETCSKMTLDPKVDPKKFELPKE